jgi:uncharacterized protein (TIGR03437 family)
MRYALFFSFAVLLPAQALIERVVGAPLHSGPGDEIGLRTAGTAWDRDFNGYAAVGDALWEIHPGGFADRIAGTGEPGYGGDGGPAVEAKVSAPANVRRDDAGNLYFRDAGNARIRKIGVDGTITTVMGNGIRWVPGMAVEGRGTELAVGGSEFDVDPAGNLYTLLGSGIVRLSLVGDGAGEVKAIAENVQASRLAADGLGAVWYVQFDGEVRRIAPGGTIQTMLPAKPGFGVGGLTADVGGNAYVVNTIPGFRGIPLPLSFTQIAPDGAVTVIPGGSLSGLYRGPSGEGVYLAGAAGVYRIVDGAAVLGYPSVGIKALPDGTPVAGAVFGNLFAVGVNQLGKMYFLDRCTVRRVDANGLLESVGPENCAGGRIEFTPAGEPVASSSTSALDAEGRVVRWFNGKLERQASDGTWVTLATSGGNEILGRDPVGNIYFVRGEGPKLRLIRIHADGSLTDVMDVTPLAGAKRINLDARGWAWSGVRATDGVRTIQLGFAGGTTGDGGPVQEASIVAETSEFGPDGSLYVLGDNRIRRITGLGKTPRPQIQRVSSSASYLDGGIAPGEIVSVLGTGLGDQELRLSTAVNNHLPNAFGRTKVLFNGVPGAVMAVRQDVVNVVVPFQGVVGAPDVKVEVQVDDAISDPFPVGVVETAFHLYSSDMSGAGQGAILNADMTSNSAANPAKKGRSIVLYGTGVGAMSPQVEDGALNVTLPYPKAVKALKVRVDGVEAQVEWQGSTPTVIGVYQINVQVPESVRSGNVPVVVEMEGGQTSRVVTVAMQ